MTDINGYYDQNELDELAPTIMIGKKIDGQQFDILEYHKNYSSNEKTTQKTSEQMFKELGYEKVNEYENTIKYHYDENGSELEIEFCSDKAIEKHYLPDYELAVFTAKEIQAINQQCKELGWLDEEEKH